MKLINSFTLGRTIFISIAIMVLLLPKFAFADALEEGKAAYLEKNYAKAMEILKPLAEEGNSEAQVTVGIMYDYGHGVEANPEEAFKWYKLAAEQGIPVVQHDLGVKYFQGIGVEQDYAEATKWWEMSSNAGLADSQFNLGLMYYRGLGHKQDFAKAKGLFEKAAEQGHGHAQYSLAVMHAFGQGIESDYKTALKWFNKSAEQNIAQAQYNLGVFYENGYGVDTDLELARSWYEKAALQNLPEAQKKLDKLAAAKKQPDPVYTPEETDVAVETASYPVAEETTPAAAPKPKRIPVSPKPETTVATPTPAPSPQPAPTSYASGDIKTTDWVMQQDPNAYTIQIGSGSTEDGIIRFLKQGNFSQVTAYVKVFVKEAYRYSALYGSFASYAEAQNAIAGLPQDIQATKPWVRKFKTVQALVTN